MSRCVGLPVTCSLAVVVVLKVKHSDAVTFLDEHSYSHSYNGTVLVTLTMTEQESEPVKRVRVKLNLSP